MLGTITFILILLFIIVVALQAGKRAKPKGILWWIKLFVLYIALMIMAAILWLLSLPLFLGLRRLPPLAVIRPIHGSLTQAMMYILPIGLTILIVCYLIYRVLKPMVQGITLGIVDISNYSPFREFIETGLFDFAENLVSLNLPGIWRSGLEILKRTPKYFRELFSEEINTMTQAESQGERAVREKKEARDRAIEECIRNNSISMTDNMTATEKRLAAAENEKIKKECSMTLE